MKNKIIFKTLMLKGEAGSTIVSMEKTGHVGTADIYTITFNDGSTTEISLENMSAITSVEKTSSTDTEDIYTITCADGSTQTFSVLNHNADIAAMSDDIDVMDARLDNFLATQTGVSNGTLRTETTLFSSTVPSMGNDENNSGYFDLEDSVDNYDEIVIRYSAFSGKSAVVTIKPDDIPVSGGSYSPMHWSEIEPNNQITIDAQNGDRSVHRFMAFTAYKFIDVDRVSIDAFVWGWNGSANSNGVVSSSFTKAWNSTNGAWQTSGFIGGIYSITGIKYEEAGTSKDPELADLRVGADGVTYASAGESVRSQVSDLKEDLGEVEDSSIVTSNFTSKFIAWGWNGNTTRGFHADSKRLSIVSPQYCPYDIVLSNLSSNFSICTIRTFTGTRTVPDNLVSTTQYNVNKGISGYVDSIILPKNTYWTVELSKPNNVAVDTSVDPNYLHFSISTSIVGDALRPSRTLLVGKAGAPYSTIQSACDDALQGDTVLILPGTYVEQVSIWGKRLNLIGVDRESTIIKDTSGLYSTPTLEMNIGSLKNLTLIETGEDNPWGADEGRSYAYTMHIESGEGYTGIGELWVDNCKFINNKHAAIGCGLYQNLHVHFNNCYMYSGRASDLPDDYYRGTFYFHTNRQDNVTGQRMTVKDCEIINESTKVFYGGVVSPGAQTGNVRSTFINNNFYAMEAENNNSNDVIISSSILNYHDCKLAVNSRGNNIPALNSV